MALVAYPLMGLAYLTARLGAVIEPVLFTGFTIIVVTQLAERTASIGDGIPGSGGKLDVGATVRGPSS